jgi:hypothetical protein
MSAITSALQAADVLKEEGVEYLVEVVSKDGSRFTVTSNGFPPRPEAVAE